MSRQCWAIASFSTTLTVLWCWKCILQIAKWLTTTPTSQPKSVQHLNWTQPESRCVERTLTTSIAWGCRSDCIGIRREPHTCKSEPSVPQNVALLHISANSHVSRMPATCNCNGSTVVLIMHWHEVYVFFLSSMCDTNQEPRDNLHGLPRMSWFSQKISY